MISRLACSLVGHSETIRIEPNSVAHQAYGKAEATEHYRCNFGLNPEYRSRISSRELVVTGLGAGGEVRIVELRGHPFFVATLFLPQLSSSAGSPHPLVVAYLKAALDSRARREAA